MHGGAVSGLLEGTPLQVVPSLQTTWGYWKAKHSETRVMVLDHEDARSYFYRTRLPWERRPKKPPTEHDTSRLGLGLALGGESIFFPFQELAKAETPISREIDGRQVRVFYEAAALTAWAEDADGNLLPGVLAYDFGRADFFPESETFKATQR